MSAAGWVIAAGAATVLVILLWPATGTRLSLRGARRARRARLPAEPPAGAAAAMLAALGGLSPVHAAAAAVCAVTCAAAVRVLVVSRRWTATAEGVARLAGVLANQAAVAVSVTDAVDRAAALVSGPVGDAAVALAEDCQRVGVAIAAERFAAAVPSSAAKSLADLVTVSAEGGGQWAQTVNILETEASQAAITARLFHAQVATAMPTLALVTALGAGLVAGASWAAEDVGAWLAGPQGATLVFAGACAVAALCARVVLPARAIALSGGLR